MENKLYIYLARRDKTEVKILAAVKGNVHMPTRLTDIKALGLPPSLEQEITQTIWDNRMLWEPWIEGVADFNQLKGSLAKRRFTNVPSYEVPAYKPDLKRVSKKIQEPVSAKLKARPINTMLRKTSS